jgi:DNA-binding MarR family transcriptional regulator
MLDDPERWLEESGIALVVVRLEDRGLIRREPDPADGRVALATLTRQGLEALRRAPVVRHARCARSTSHV